MLHYVKRELETLFVHHWGPQATMPARNLFKNSIYYWRTCAAFVNGALSDCAGFLSVRRCVCLFDCASAVHFAASLARLRRSGPVLVLQFFPPPYCECVTQN